MTAVHSRAEIEDAFAEFRRLGAQTRQWDKWSALFTPDARYVEHGRRRSFHGPSEILGWLTEAMIPVAPMTFSADWWIIDGDRVALYVWNHLPDPGGARGEPKFSFPNLTVLEYAGDGRWCLEEDFYNPADAAGVVTAWYQAGGRPDMAPDETILGPLDHAPFPWEAMHTRQEVAAAFDAYRTVVAGAVQSGNWDAWADQFHEDARYYEHRYGRFAGRGAIRAWIRSAMQPFPATDSAVNYVIIESNRVVFSVANRLPGGFSFDVGSILHFGPDNMWTYEEDAYNPQEAVGVIARWAEH